MSIQRGEVDPSAREEQLAAYRAFVQDAIGAGFADPTEAMPDPVSTLTPHEVEILYGLPKPPVDTGSLPTIQGERACKTQPATFLVDRHDDNGKKRSREDVHREIAAAKQICRACVALSSCRLYADAVQAAMPPRSSAKRDSHFVIMAGIAYAR